MNTKAKRMKTISPSKCDREKLDFSLLAIPILLVTANGVLQKIISILHNAKPYSPHRARALPIPFMVVEI
jgi:hypothetical protein